MLRIIGLCGGSGSGKGTVAKILSERGAVHIDADRVYHSLVSGPSPLMTELIREFGEGVVTEDGGLNRSVLASIVFADGAHNKQKKLNSITHRYVLDKIRLLINEFAHSGYKCVIVDAPLLFESGFNEECETVICVIAPRSARIARIVSRDKISATAAEKRIASQIPDEKLIDLCDRVIFNDKDLEQLRRKVTDLADALNI